MSFFAPIVSFRLQFISGLGFTLFVASCAASAPPLIPPEVPPAPPAEPIPEPVIVSIAPGVDWGARLAAINEVVGDAITEGKIPGCVVAIGRHDGLLFERAYGSRSLVPEQTPMDVATVFDLATRALP